MSGGAEFISSIVAEVAAADTSGSAVGHSHPLFVDGLLLRSNPFARRPRKSRSESLSCVAESERMWCAGQRAAYRCGERLAHGGQRLYPLLALL